MTMRPRLLWVTVGLGLAIASLLAALAAHGQNTFRLKPGAGGQVCVDCHSNMAEKLKSKFVHTPVKTGNCAGCHSPHTSAHGKLLSASPDALCRTCHTKLIPENAASVHKVVVEGNCVKCHDPHGSNNKANLLKTGNELCVTCHKALGDTIAKASFKHTPVSNDCLGCHNPHASANAPHLLKSAVPALCIQCHKPDSPRFTQQHVNYPVARADCVSCHDPHGSNVAGILFDTVHPPVASKRCNQCHDAATAANPFATRRAGFELCRGCHSTMMNETFSKSQIHWPLVDKAGCLSCHPPHAARQKKLLKAAGADLCGQCHQDTIDRQVKLGEKAAQEKAATAGRVRAEKGALTHEPVQAGSCLACHQPHASDSARLMRQASVVEGCGACHDWLKHNSHPMGEKYRDMRNKNLSVDCLSCHLAHGTGYRHMITFPTPTELCVQCHARLRR
jgi:DmsE family decaheme c-type cytochrome